VRQPRVAEQHAAGVHREEAAPPGEVRGAVGGHGQGEHRDRVQAGGGQRDSPQEESAEQADGDADRGARGQLPDDLADDERGGCPVRPGLAEQRDREH
jgi:hypothetical protein